MAITFESYERRIPQINALLAQYGIADLGSILQVGDEVDARIVATMAEDYVGIVKESTLKEFTAIIEKMKNERGIQALILGCTELPLLLNKNNCPVDCLDSVEIHLQKLIELARD